MVLKCVHPTICTLLWLSAKVEILSDSKLITEFCVHSHISDRDTQSAFLRRICSDVAEKHSWKNERSLLKIEL